MRLVCALGALAMLVLALTFWLMTIAAPMQPIVPPAAHTKTPGRLHKPPGRPLPGFAEARGEARSR